MGSKINRYRNFTENMFEISRKNDLRLKSLEDHDDMLERKIRKNNLIFYVESEITRFHRLSRKTNAPILVEIPKLITRISLLRNSYKFRDDNIFVNKDYTLKTREQRRNLISRKRELSEKGIRPKLRDNKPLANGQKYEVFDGRVDAPDGCPPEPRTGPKKKRPRDPTSRTPQGTTRWSKPFYSYGIGPLKNIPRLAKDPTTTQLGSRKLENKSHCKMWSNPYEGSASRFVPGATEVPDFISEELHTTGVIVTTRLPTETFPGKNQKERRVYVTVSRPQNEGPRPSPRFGVQSQQPSIA
ncbi:hypothetical protein LAZ67_13001555 [Cordylochernes scorpioides]|uniref:Uncharacterized protein n=1 Tax=Cordylochernes scorpioides TaxID=51811 RepID=A0ABY6L3Y3_9ARAC|nr:hypothetical protein LAZ67_13001555 [Cordylochernes scorpioides]